MYSVVGPVFPGPLFENGGLELEHALQLRALRRGWNGGWGGMRATHRHRRVDLMHVLGCARLRLATR